MRISTAICLVVFVSACSAGGTGIRRDGGVAARDGSLRDSGSGRRDGGPPLVPVDAGPTFPDASCGATTPIETTIIGDPPDMLLTVDISGSMCTPLIETGSFDTKLAIMKAALTGLVGEWDSRINFGMMLFPGNNACGAGAIRNNIAPRNGAPISTTLSALDDGFISCGFSNAGATPTHLSVDAARGYFASIPVNPIGRFMILATDGIPNCGPEIPDSMGATEETVDETVAAIEALRIAGINTYVLGFGSGFDGAEADLARMAVAGGTGSAFSATTPAALDTALEMIAAEIVPPSCTVELDGPPRSPELFQVRFDGGALIPRNPGHSSGWDYDSGTNTITFYGSECTRVQSGDVASIDVDFGCPGPLI